MRTMNVYSTMYITGYRMILTGITSAQMKDKGKEGQGTLMKLAAQYIKEKAKFPKAFAMLFFSSVF